MNSQMTEVSTEHEVFSDTRTVWVNSGTTGCCLARFGKGGIDIHHDVEEQARTGQQCLDCTHSLPTIADWHRFVRVVAKVYGTEVSEEHRPEWLVE